MSMYLFTRLVTSNHTNYTLIAMIFSLPCSGYEGDVCEKFMYDKSKPTYDLSYYGGLRCGGNVTQATTISTPGYPARQKVKPGCSWWISPPEVGMAIQVKFDDFSFREPDKEMESKCAYEKVELRSKNVHDPMM